MRLSSNLEPTLFLLREYFLDGKLKWGEISTFERVYLFMVSGKMVSQNNITISSKPEACVPNFDILKTAPHGALIVHNHPNGPRYPSHADRVMAHKWVQFTHVIICPRYHLTAYDYYGPYLDTEFIFGDTEESIDE